MFSDYSWNQSDCNENVHCTNRSAQHHCFSFFQVICSQLPVTRTFFYFPWRFELLGFDCSIIARFGDNSYSRILKFLKFLTKLLSQAIQNSTAIIKVWLDKTFAYFNCRVHRNKWPDPLIRAPTSISFCWVWRYFTEANSRKGSR